MTLEWTDDGAFDLGNPLNEIAFATSKFEKQPGAFSTACRVAILLQDDGDEGDIDQLDGDELQEDVDEEFAEDELEEEEFDEDLDDIDDDDDFSDDFDDVDEDDDDF